MKQTAENIEQMFIEYIKRKPRREEIIIPTEAVIKKSKKAK